MNEQSKEGGLIVIKKDFRLSHVTVCFEIKSGCTYSHVFARFYLIVFYAGRACIDI